MDGNIEETQFIVEGRKHKSVHGKNKVTMIILGHTCFKLIFICKLK